MRRADPAQLFQPWVFKWFFKSSRTSDSRQRRCPPSVLIEVNFPAFAQRVTVFGSTRKSDATSEGVNKTSASVSRLISSLPEKWCKRCPFRTFRGEVSVYSQGKSNTFSQKSHPLGLEIARGFQIIQEACSKAATLRQRVINRSYPTPAVAPSLAARPASDS